MRFQGKLQVEIGDILLKWWNEYRRDDTGEPYLHTHNGPLIVKHAQPRDIEYDIRSNGTH